MGMGLMAIGVGLIAIAFGILAWNVLKMVGAIFFASLYNIFNWFYLNVCVRSELEKDGFLRKKQEEKQLAKELEEANKKNLYEAQKKAENDKIIYATMQKTNALRAKYPLADKELFDKYMNSYNSCALCVSNAIAQEIKTQHMQRVTTDASRTYTIDDVKDMIKIEERFQDYIHATMYQNGLDYVVVLENDRTNCKMLHSTNNIVLAKRIIVNAMNMQIMKNVNSLYNNGSLSQEDMNEAIVNSVNQVNQYKNA